MINKEMKEHKSKTEEKKAPTKVNEVGGVYFSSSVKIFDPNSQQILVQKRGDD